jgi:hypothetical protein
MEIAQPLNRAIPRSCRQAFDLGSQSARRQIFRSAHTARRELARSLGLLCVCSDGCEEDQHHGESKQATENVNTTFHTTANAQPCPGTARTVCGPDILAATSSRIGAMVAQRSVNHSRVSLIRGKTGSSWVRTIFGPGVSGFCDFVCWRLPMIRAVSAGFQPSDVTDSWHD